MTLSCVFLDFGNTLVHEVPSRFAIYAEAAADRGADRSESEMRELMVRAHRETPPEADGGYRYTDRWFRSYIERIFHDYLGLAREGLPALQEELFARFSDARTFQLFPGARELLSSLKGQGLGLGVISNWSPRLPGLIERLELGPVFDVVVCSAIERLEKPQPEIFELALERAGVSAAEALHAGDHPDKDCRAATAVGMRAVLVDHSGKHANGADAPRVTSLLELEEHILAQVS